MAWLKSPPSQSFAVQSGYSLIPVQVLFPPELELEDELELDELELDELEEALVLLEEELVLLELEELDDTEPVSPLTAM